MREDIEIEPTLEDFVEDLRVVALTFALASDPDEPASADDIPMLRDAFLTILRTCEPEQPAEIRELTERLIKMVEDWGKELEPLEDLASLPEP